MRRGNFVTGAPWGARAFVMPVLAALCAALFASHAGAGETRTLSFYNIHTEETVRITYKKDGEYLPAGMKRINHIMRDWRRDEPTEMDPELIDLIWELHTELGSQKPIHLISGYRSRKTNEKLRKAGGGQARNSRHILGKAADIHFPDVSVKKLRNSALVREAGGVGYYPGSGIPFVHVDTGRVRHWPRLPRLELAALFPDGETAHVPRDGKPITVADARRAAKSGKYPGPPTRVAKAEEKPERSPVVLASLGASALPALADTSAITGSIPDQPERIVPEFAKKGPALLQLASTDPLADLFRQRTRPAAATAPRADAPDHDPEHAGEPGYQPAATPALLRDTPVARDLHMAALAQPDYGRSADLLAEPDPRLAGRMRMKPHDAGRRLAIARTFTGPAVTNLLVAETDAPASAPSDPERQPSETAPGEVLTASTQETPAPAASSPASGGFSGGTGMSFGFGFR